MYAERHTVSVLTDGAGVATAYSQVLTGKIISIRYVKTDFTDGVSFTITAEATGETIWAQAAVNASTTVAPRQAVHDPAGAAALFAAGGTALRDHIVLAKDRVKVDIAGGGTAHTGTFHIIVE